MGIERVVLEVWMGIVLVGLEVWIGMEREGASSFCGASFLKAMPNGVQEVGVNRSKIRSELELSMRIERVELEVRIGMERM